MTVPVTPAAPAARAMPAPSGAGPADSATPFASALDGALAGGAGAPRHATSAGNGQPAPGDRTPGDRAPGDDGDGDGDGDGGTTEDAVASSATGTTAADVVAASVAAPFWVLALVGDATGAGSAGRPVPGPVGTPSVGTPSVDTLPADTLPVGGTAGPGTGPATAAARGGVLTGRMPAEGAPVPAPGGSAVAAAAATWSPAGTPATVVVPQDPQAAPAPPVPGPAAGGVPGSSGPAGTDPGPIPAPEPTGGSRAPALGGALPEHAGAAPGQDRPEQDPGPAATAAPAAADGDTAPALSGPLPGGGPFTVVPPVAGTERVTGTATAQPVPGQVAHQVAVLTSAGNGSHTMTMILDPEHLGPVEVQVTVSQGNLDLHLRSASDLGRAALLDALPELRRDLEAAGLNPSRVEVDAGSGGSWLARHAAEQQTQQHSGDRGAQRNPTGEGFRSRERPADSGEGLTGPPTRSTSSGVDVLV